MQIAVEKLSGISRKLRFEIDKEQIKNSFAAKIQEIRAKLHLNGFRLGRVPEKLVIQKYGFSVYREVVDLLINETLNKVLTEHNLDVIGEVEAEKIENIFNPEENAVLEVIKIQNISCTFKFAVYPEVDLNNLDQLIYNYPVVAVTAEDVANKLMDLRKKFGTQQVVDRAAILGDIVTIDYRGSIDGKEFAGGTGENLEVELGGEQFIDGFESGLLGSKEGDSLNLELKFPDDYADMQLAGKPVVFAIKVKQVAVKQLAELDQKFAQMIRLPDDDVGKIEERIKEILDEEAADLVRSKQIVEIKDVLVKSYPIELPEKLITLELASLRDKVIKEYSDRGIKLKNLNPNILEKLQVQAKSNVHESLLLRAIIKQNDLKYDNKLINKQLHDFDNNFKGYPNFKKMRANFHSSLVNADLYNSALKFIASKATKIEQPMTLVELNKLMAAI